MRLRALWPGSALLTLALGAPPAGTELEAGGETGAYHYVGACGGPHNYDNYNAAQIRARHRRDNGFVAVGEGTALFARVVDSDASQSTVGPQIGRRESYAMFALRLGYEGRYGGFELGPAAGYFPTQGGEAGGYLLPSARVWAGRYGAVHAWGSILADRTLSLNRIVGAGIGHRSDRVKASLGLAASAGSDTTGIADLDVAVWRNLWLGAGVQVGQTRHTWGAGLRVGFFIDAVPPARISRQPDGEPEPAALQPAPPPAAATEPSVSPSVDVEDAAADAGVTAPDARQ
jgi:hypothetical protein